MIKVDKTTNTATRESIPLFLRGLSADSLANLSWTDESLCVQHLAFWQEVDISEPLEDGEVYDGEALTPNFQNQTVEVTKQKRQKTQEEVDAERKAKTPQSVEAWKAREMLEVMGLTTQIETTLSTLDPLVAARYRAFTVFERNDALIVMFASQLGFTDAQTDSMFIVANQITSASTRADIEALLRAEGLMA